MVSKENECCKQLASTVALMLHAYLVPAQPITELFPQALEVKAATAQGYFKPLKAVRTALAWVRLKLPNLTSISFALRACQKVLAVPGMWSPPLCRAEEVQNAAWQHVQKGKGQESEERGPTHALQPGSTYEPHSIQRSCLSYFCSPTFFPSGPPNSQPLNSYQSSNSNDPITGPYTHGTG